MKKITTIKFAITLVMIGFSTAFAQYNFLSVPYVGAMDQNDWTKTWTNWDPENFDYPSVNETVTLNAAATGNGKIVLSNTTLDKTKVYLLTGIVYVPNGVTLNIPAGTVIRGEGDATSANWAVIVVQRGGKINAMGTKDAPIVFTSNKAKGNFRKPGDWGGIIILGKARNNQPGGGACASCVKGESLIEGPFGYPDGVHGGNDDGDNSGSIDYVRIEFPGIVFAANNEINGLTLGSVGNKTHLRHVQVSLSNDDSYEWFGGTVNSRYLVAFKGTDDDFDTDYGYRGMNQFGIGFKDSIHYDPTWAATSGGSTSEGFESDNDATGTVAQPKTKAVFSNYTMVGPYAVGETFSQHSTTVKGAYRRGARIRRNSAQSIVNSIFIGYRNGIMLDGALTETNANATDPSPVCDTLEVRNTIIMGMTASRTATATGNIEVATGRDTGVIGKWLRESGNRINPVAWSAGTLLTDPNNYKAPNFVPVTGSPALTGSDFTNCKVTPNELKVKTLLNNGSMNLYPNPSNGTAHLELNLVNHATLSISILTIDGKVIRNLNDTFAAGKSLVTFEGLSQGVYIVKVAQNGSANNLKLIVK